MSTFMPSKWIIGSLSVIFLTMTLTIVVLELSLLDVNDKSIVNAQVVDIDEPPTNVTEELDVKVDAREPLPLNGTLVADISGADDIDIDAIPPQGISIIVTNTTLTVTNNPVEIIEGTAEAAAATQPNTAGLDTDTSTASNNENDGEGSTGNDDDAGGGGGSSESDEPNNTSDSSDDDEDEEE